MIIHDEATYQRFVDALHSYATIEIMGSIFYVSVATFNSSTGERSVELMQAVPVNDV